MQPSFDPSSFPRSFPAAISGRMGGRRAAAPGLAAGSKECTTRHARARRGFRKPHSRLARSAPKKPLRFQE